MHMLEFKKVTDFPRGTLYNILCDAYSYDDRNKRIWDGNWKETDDFFYDNPEIADKYGLVTCLDGEPIGFITWDPRNCPEYVEIGHNGIREKYKRQGYGYKQLEEAIRRIKEYKGLKRIIVCTNSNLAAPKNYESVGFRLYEKKTNETESSYTGDYLYYEIVLSKKVLCIGGSPCAGKSTVAERISKEYGAYYYKVDDHIDEFINLAAEKGYTTCKNCLVMTPEENWMRPPAMQRDEEFDIYDEMSEFVFDFLDKIDSDFIITEGAAYTPKIIKKYGIQEYITIIPTPEFQISHYKEREYVPYVLEGCSDKQKAFDNWMQRDILFAEYVRSECEKNDIPCIINDGLISKDEMFEKVKKLFGL